MIIYVTAVKFVLDPGHLLCKCICDRICEKVPFSHTKFDPFFEL